MEEIWVPHAGWVGFQAGDDVGRYLTEGWFEYLEQALFWLYLSPGSTVIDCGAHVGLFTLVAAAATHGQGSIVAIEPVPDNARLLRHNIETNGIGCARVVEAAADACDGTVSLHPGRPGKSAYSSLHGAAVDIANATGISGFISEEQITVPAVTLAEVIASSGLAHVDLLKLDVEGAEIEALHGLEPALGRVSLLMVEFAEDCLERVGRSSRDLHAALESHGLRVCRFDPEGFRLEPAQWTGPIRYENLYATADLDAANGRLRGASAAHRRIAREIIRRGACRQGLRGQPGSDETGVETLRFAGWKFSAGLGAIEGPFPQFDLPHVCWGEGRCSRLTFEADGSPMALLLEARSGCAGQEAVVSLDGTALTRLDFPAGGQFQAWSIPFAVPRGSHEIELSYKRAEPEAGGSRTLAVLFRTLCIAPDFSPGSRRQSEPRRTRGWSPLARLLRGVRRV